MTNQLSTVLADIIQAAPALHRAGTFSGGVLEAIYQHAAKSRILDSAETGSGASTLLFSHLSERHTVFALDDGTDSIHAVRASPLFRPEAVTFVEGPTQLTLPRHLFEHKLQLALIDGPHGYPFPDLEYYYLYQHLDVGALLIVDDIHIRSVNNLFEFIRADDMFHLEQVVETTALFRRTHAPTFSPVGDGWWTQGYNRGDFEITPAEEGISDTLVRVQTPTPFYLDELGPVQNPLRRLRLQVPAGAPLLVSGWAIDATNQRPAAWIEMVLDGHVYRTDVRMPRGDVASAHGGFRNLRCGFKTTLPPASITPGRHSLALRVVIDGGLGYFEAPEITFAAR